MATSKKAEPVSGRTGERSKPKGSRESRPQVLPSTDCWRVDEAFGGALLVDHAAGQLLISKEQAVDLIDFGSVYVEGRQERNPARSLAGGEEIRVCWPWKGIRRFYEIDPTRILYEDRYLLAYDKEASIPSQQTPSDGYNNLFAALYRYLERKGFSEPYVALHHRLDQETSGVMVFALDRSANHNLGNAFMHRKVIKDYLAWVDGIPSRNEWMAEDDIGRKNGRYCVCPKGQGKPAQTAFTVICREETQTDVRKPTERLEQSGETGQAEQMNRPARSLVLARPLTGRTHQIRLHLAASGHPVLGDRLYGGKVAKRLHLHAYRIELPHPITRKQLTLTACVPPDWPPPHSVAIPDQRHT